LVDAENDMQRVNRSVAAVLLGVAFLPSAFTSADEPKRKDPAGAPAQKDAEDSGWQKVFRAMAADYEISPVEETPSKFALRTAPVLRWSQPVRGGDDGAVYVWLDRGRPAVIGALFAYPRADGTRVVVHEMHALTMAPMHAEYKGNDVWSLDTPALEFKRLSGAAAPAASSAQRLAQMRTLGREFTAKSIDRDKRDWELRLLAQPLYRYELKDHPELLDGAILAFVQGTDPEILMILEARRDEDKAYWQYALARFSDLQLVLHHKEVEVWSVSYSRLNESTAPYYVRDVATLRLTDLEGGTSKAK
jgi:hypothetical protein